MSHEINIIDEAKRTTPGRIIACCRLIETDMAADVSRMEGRYLTEKLLGEMHGNLAAAVSALAGMVAHLAGEQS